MCNCKVLISSHADVPICQPPEIMKLRNASWKFVFLQHGVIKDDISRWLNGKKIDLFITSTKTEHESISGAHSPYVFTTKEVKLTGLPRFDALQEAADRVIDQPKNLVIFAPTWRHWLFAGLKPGSQERQVIDGFDNSDFVTSWRDLLSNPA